MYIYYNYENGYIYYSDFVLSRVSEPDERYSKLIIFSRADNHKS